MLLICFYSSHTYAQTQYNHTGLYYQTNAKGKISKSKQKEGENSNERKITKRDRGTPGKCLKGDLEFISQLPTYLQFSNTHTCTSSIMEFSVPSVLCYHSQILFLSVKCHRSTYRSSYLYYTGHCIKLHNTLHVTQYQIWSCFISSTQITVKMYAYCFKVIMEHILFIYYQEVHAGVSSHFSS